MNGQCDRLIDSLALVDLYNGTGGPAWIYTWDLSKPMNTWYGITLNSEGCVQCIDLDGRLDCSGSTFNNLGNNLDGQIPESIGNLSQVEFISFGNNFLTGPIPSTIGLLTELTDLILRYNNLTGTIPSELGNLQNLDLLNLTSNDLTGKIPDELGFSERLSWIFLSSNDLTGEIPSTLSNLNQLIALGAADNHLSGEIPGFLGNILDRLHLQNNEFVGCFPEELMAICKESVIFTGNIALPWQGDFEQFCDGNEQIGAPCEDGLSDTENFINEDCECETITSTTSINNTLLRIFPNPVSKGFCIEDQNYEEYEFTLFTIAGQKIDMLETNCYDMSHLPLGIYILSSQHVNTRQLTKIIKH